jgi:hypothetical protein
MAVFTFASVLWGALIYMFEPHIETFIMGVVKENKGASTREDLSKEMEVRKSFVTYEIGKMYKDFKETQKNITAFNDTWIPHLEKEKNFYYVGFFYDLVEEKVKYKDFDGDILPCWHDDQGWYYMKQGYKFYR